MFCNEAFLWLLIIRSSDSVLVPTWALNVSTVCFSLTCFCFSLPVACDGTCWIQGPHDSEPRFWFPLFFIQAPSSSDSEKTHQRFWLLGAPSLHVWSGRAGCDGFSHHALCLCDGQILINVKLIKPWLLLSGQICCWSLSSHKLQHCELSSIFSSESDFYFVKHDSDLTAPEPDPEPETEGLKSCWSWGFRVLQCWGSDSPGSCSFRGPVWNPFF